MADIDFQALQQHIRTFVRGCKVYKDECMYSYDNPESVDGLFVCLATYYGLGKRHVQWWFEKTGHPVFLNIRRIKKELPKPEQDTSKKPTRLAIGVEGGFSLDEKQYETEETYSIVILPQWTTVPYPSDAIPSQVSTVIKAIINADSAYKQDELAAMAGTWDGEVRQISKHAKNLKQLPATHKIPPSNWKCERCDLRENLWLNLTDGTILCGRRFWDGSGGNNHAVDHFQECGYPLAVKLGTITSEGGDVFSYSEDDMVQDPQLAQHLAHWGIDIMKMTKTEKTMTELEIDMNQKIGEWDVIQESGSQLQPAYGPGYTGMHNLGNSCYMNSVMQVLFTLPPFREKYFDNCQQIFRECVSDPCLDVPVQLAKLSHGLLSGDYSHAPPKPSEDNKEPQIAKSNGIRPVMFKTLIGKGHPEFSTKRQQDAQEFYLHIINLIERNSRGSENPCDCMKFQMEERIECMKSQKVMYKYRSEYILALPIPMEATINKEEVAAYEERKREAEAAKKPLMGEDLVRAKVPLVSCLENFVQPEYIEGFYSSAVQGNSTAIKTSRIATFPDYLIIQLKKFTLGDDWVPKKLDVSIDMPDFLDLSKLRGVGRQSWEEELPDAKAPKEPEFQINEGLVQQLVEMGFPVEGCRKAVYHTKNMGLESAASWVMEHMADPDFAEPLQIAGSSGGGNEASGFSFVPNEEAVVMITSMGFSAEQATKALKATNNNVERAADWIFSHADELDEEPMDEDIASAASSQQLASNTHCKDGEPRYQLAAFISHMGTSTMVGHYVCHIRKEGKWVIFNDEKVALSEKPPKDLGYIYLYQRAT